jgi:hypothetical protein
VIAQVFQVPAFGSIWLPDRAMSSPTPADTSDPPSPQLVWAIVQIAVIWTLSDMGFYFLLPTLGVQLSYNTASISISLYYVFWVGVAFITYWHLYSRWTTFDNRISSYIVWSLSFVGCTLFAAYVLPLLPPTSWTEPWKPPDVRLATPWYFLPKSVEILFQQLLIVAMALTLAQHYTIKKLSAYCAALFGAMHVLLLLAGMPLGYVVRFMVAATLFGSVFPYLILRVPNGLAYSYVVHWIYYAVTVVMPRIFSSSQ